MQTKEALAKAREMRAVPIVRYTCKTGTHGAVTLYIENTAAACPCGPMKKERL